MFSAAPFWRFGKLPPSPLAWSSRGGPVPRPLPCSPCCEGCGLPARHPPAHPPVCPSPACASPACPSPACASPAPRRSRVAASALSCPASLSRGSCSPLVPLTALLTVVLKFQVAGGFGLFYLKVFLQCVVIAVCSSAGEVLSADGRVSVGERARSLFRLRSRAGLLPGPQFAVTTAVLSPSAQNTFLASLPTHAAGSSSREPSGSLLCRLWNPLWPLRCAVDF